MEFSKTLLDNISHCLRERNETISSAESVTSRFLQLAFSPMQGAQEFYNGGITAYTIEQKVKHLQVDQKEAKEVNCVSKNITETMAINVAELQPRLLYTCSGIRRRNRRILCYCLQAAGYFIRPH